MMKQPRFLILSAVIILIAVVAYSLLPGKSDPNAPSVVFPGSCLDFQKDGNSASVIGDFDGDGIKDMSITLAERETEVQDSKLINDSIWYNHCESTSSLLSWDNETQIFKKVINGE